MSDQSRCVYAPELWTYILTTHASVIYVFLTLKSLKNPNSRVALGQPAIKLMGVGDGVGRPKAALFFGSLVILDVVRCY